MTDAWISILRAVRRYPSPHNSQPIRLRIVDARTAEVHYDLDRGLPAEPYGIPFGFVCVGVFVELFAIAAHAEGFAVTERLSTQDMAFDGDQRLHPMGTLTLSPAVAPVPDLDVALIDARRTSRLPYGPREVGPEVIEEVSAEAACWGHRLATTTRRQVVDEIVAVNQRTLFDDLATPAVRDELRTWLRYTRADAAGRRDGLSAECLHVPGPVLRWFVEHHRWWSLPVLGWMARRIYLRTMRGVRQLAWLTGPFATNADFVRAGRALIRIWLRLTAHGVAVHPLGSVITNPRSRAALVAAVGGDEGPDMTWMLLRIGYSPPPPRSHRLPAHDLLIGGPR